MRDYYCKKHDCDYYDLAVLDECPVCVRDARDGMFRNVTDLASKLHDALEAAARMEQERDALRLLVAEKEAERDRQVSRAIGEMAKEEARASMAERLLVEVINCMPGYVACGDFSVEQRVHAECVALLGDRMPSPSRWDMAWKLTKTRAPHLGTVGNQ